MVCRGLLAVEKVCVKLWRNCLKACQRYWVCKGVEKVCVKVCRVSKVCVMVCRCLCLSTDVYMIDEDVWVTGFLANREKVVYK